VLDDGPELPVLKEKEEERKGAGAAWYAGSSSAPSGAILGAGSAARIGSGLANPGFLGSARIAAALSRMFGGPATILGSLFASPLGGQLLLAGMLALGGLLALAGLKASGLLGAASADPLASRMFSSLPGVLSSGLVIDKPKNRSLDWLEYANRGELVFEEAGPGQEKDAPAEDQPAAEQPKPPDVTIPDIPLNLGDAGKIANAAKAALNPDGFAKRLTNDAGQLYAGGPGALRDAASMALGKKAGDPTPAALGLTKKVAPLERRKEAARATRGNTRQGVSDRAMGQLKLARNLSNYGARSSDAAKAKGYATDAFEQGQTIGGGLGMPGEGIVVPPGDGAPGVTDADSTPDVSPPVNATPYQGPLDDAKGKDNNAAMLKILGAILLAMGIILALIGMKLMSNPFTQMIGIILLLIGLALIAAGIACLIASSMMGNDAKGSGKKIANQYGQKDQGQGVNEAADQAVNDGVNADQFTPSHGPDYYNNKLKSNSVRQDVLREANANYTLR
jgi:xanthosine utilization system XapX-like protein